MCSADAFTIHIAGGHERLSHAIEYFEQRIEFEVVLSAKFFERDEDRIQSIFR